MKRIAVVLSDMILMRLSLVFTNDFRANKIAFSVRALICIILSSERHAPSVDTLPLEAPQPSSKLSV